MSLVTCRVSCGAREGIAIEERLFLDIRPLYPTRIMPGEPRSSTGPPICFLTINEQVSGFGSEALYCSCHQPAEPNRAMDFSLFQWQSSVKKPGSVLASGSCSGRILAVWSSIAPEDVRYSVFDCGITEPLMTESLPFEIPRDGCLSMSRDPAEGGILLAWKDADRIMVRHWQESWNVYGHEVAAGVGELALQGLEVCRACGGYWLGWLEENGPSPYLIFLSEDSVTAVEEGSGPDQGLDPSAHPNPCRCGRTILVEGLPPGARISVLDISGRVIRSASSDSARTFHWSGANRSGRSYPPGIYLISVAGPAVRKAVSVVLLPETADVRADRHSLRVA